MSAFGAPAPAPAPGGGLFGSTPAPAPAGGGLFGPAPAPSTSLFGSTPAPAPAGGGLFGSTPAPAPPGGLFGSAPSSGGLFGSTPAPAPGGLFGNTASAPGAFGGFGSAAPAPSAFGGFGSTAPAPSSAFGASSSLPNNQAQIPAQAALQAHMDATAQIENHRVQTALQDLHVTYSGATVAGQQPKKKTNFIAIVYNELTPEQRQIQWLHSVNTNGVGGPAQPILAPNKPPQLSEEEWQEAVVSNPDPTNFMPVPLIGATSLQARLSWQQDKSNQLAENIASIKSHHESLANRSTTVAQRAEQLMRQHAFLRKRLIDVMCRVEIARCMNQPLQAGELEAKSRLRALLREAEAARNVLRALDAKCQGVTTSMQSQSVVQDEANVLDHTKVLPVIKEHRESIAKLMNTAKKDIHDIKLVSDHLAKKTQHLTL